MQILFYTITAILLYLVSDWILVKLEASRGKRFASRSIIFFIIILVLSVVVFEGVQLLVADKSSSQENVSAKQDLEKTPALSVPE